MARAVFPATLWISEWPRLEVVLGFLWPLVLAPQVRRSLWIVAEPVPTAAALNEARSDWFDYLSDQVNGDRRGQITDYTGVEEFGRRRRGVGIGASTPAAAIRPAASCAHATSPLTSIPCGGRSA